MDDDSQAFFNDLRTAHFPKHCNYLSAHLTLFHHLPSGEPLISETLTGIAGRHDPFSCDVAGLKNMGNGVAYVIVSPILQQIHRELQAELAPFLISQDRQKIWPHITVQNKVTAHKASETVDLLQQTFTPVKMYAVGFQLWHYMKGPWEFITEILFSGKGGVSSGAA